MLFGAGGYIPVGYGLHEGLWGVFMPVVYQTPRGMHPAPYNGMSFLARDYRYEAGRHTCKKFASETTYSKRFPTQVPIICVVPG